MTAAGGHGVAARGDRRYWVHSDPDEGTSDGQRYCARGQWCSGSVMVRQPDGSYAREPARTPRAFCEHCRTKIGAALSSLPECYVRLALEIGEPAQGAQRLRMPFGPRMPLRGDVDALMRLMAESLASWHERVAFAASLSPPDTESTRRDHGRAVDRACLVLAAHLDALLALEPGPMIRAEGDTLALTDLSGADAGNEILTVHYRARAVLGQTRPRPESYDGVPCRECEDFALERAEPPSDPAEAAMHSKCASCGHEMTAAEFAEWVGRYGTWAQGGGAIICRVCRQGRHSECTWRGCSCGARRHAALRPAC